MTFPDLFMKAPTINLSSAITLVFSLLLFVQCEEEQLPPAKPELVSPTANADNQGYNITFSWKSSDNANSYTFQLSLSDDFSNSELFRESIKNTSLDVSNLKPSAVYFWRVNAVNGAGASAWSASNMFTTESLGVPSLISPENNVTNSLRSIEFKWSTVADAGTYQLQLSTTDDFSNLVAIKTDLTQALWTINNLMFSTDYFWRVRAEKNGEKSEWSSTHKLTTEPLGIPQLQSPLDNAQSVSNSIEFTWSAVEEATSYNLQVSNSSDFSTIALNKGGLTTSSYTGVLPMTNSKYYWRVSAQVDNCQSGWSTIRIVNIAVIPTDGLVAWYPFNGNAHDESGNGNHGTIVGGVTTTTDRKDQNNKAFFFNGSSGYIEIPTLNSFQYKPISYSVWVIVDSYFPLSPGHKFRSIIGRQEFGNPYCGMLGFFADMNIENGAYDNAFLYWMGAASQPDTPYSQVKPSLNTWVHLVFTQDNNGNFKFYINGVLTNAGNLSNTQNANISFRIGSGIGANSYFWNNKIDDVRIYNRILTSQEVTTLYSE